MVGTEKLSIINNCSGADDAKFDRQRVTDGLQYFIIKKKNDFYDLMIFGSPKSSPVQSPAPSYSLRVLISRGQNGKLFEW